MPQIVAPPENKVIEKRPIITTCPHCQYTISYTEDEVERLSDEIVGVYCPNCAKSIITDNIEPFTFPKSFYHFGASEDAVCLSDEEVQEYVDIVKRKLKQECKVGDFAMTGAGDTMVFRF